MFKKVLIVLSAVLLFVGCAQETPISKSNVVTTDQPALEFEGGVNCEELSQAALDVAYTLGAFHDNMFEDGTDSVEARNIRMLAAPHGLTIPLDTIVARYVLFHHMDESIVEDYFNTAIANKAFIEDTDNREEIIDALYCYGSDQLEVRGIFSTIASWISPGDCTFAGVMGHLIDATGSFLAACVATSIPILNALGWANFVDDYGSYIGYILGC